MLEHCLASSFVVSLGSWEEQLWREERQQPKETDDALTLTGFKYFHKGTRRNGPQRVTWCNYQQVEYINMQAALVVSTKINCEPFIDFVSRAMEYK